LTATPVSAATYSETVLADAPLAYYRFEEPVDATGIVNAVNPDLYAGLATFDDLQAYPKFAQAGILTQSVGFHLYTQEGVAEKSHIEIPYDPALNPAGPFTVELWARVTSWGANNRCIVGNISGFSDGWWFRQEPGATPRWIYVQNGGGVYMAGGSITKDEWAHLVVTYDGTTFRFYGNGTQQWSAGAPAGGPKLNTGMPLCIGGEPMLGGEDFFDGNVDEVAIYDKALTSQQIAAHYEIGRTSITVPPVPASIIEDPVPVSAYAGRTARFSVNATGTTPLSYQWYKSDKVMDGKTNDLLEFTCAYADNGATFKCVVTNLYGSAASTPAALAVLTDLRVESSPASVTRTVGSKVAFRAVPGGALPVTYQWYKGASVIPGATNQTLWLSNVQLADSEASYYARIANPWNVANTDPATLAVVDRAVTVPVTGYAKVVMADDPVAFWRLNEPDGSATAVDAAGSFDGSYLPGTGTLTYGATPGIPHETDPAISVTGKAQVQIPYALELNPHGPFSVELWIKPAAPNPGPDFIDVATSEGTGPHGWLLYQMLDNSLVWVLFSENWNAGWLGGAPPVEANSWYHIVMTYDGALYRSYCNGNPVTAMSYDAFVPNGDGWTSLGFRFDGGGSGFDGAIDDVAFYNKALSLDQVQAHYNATVKVSIAQSGNNVVLSWPFGTLQQAEHLPGGFTDLTTAASPHTNVIGTTPKFYRVRIQ
jgi:hypothetical protein